MAHRSDIVERTEGAIDRHTAPRKGECKDAPGERAHTTDRGTLRREHQDEAAESWFGLDPRER